MAEFTPFQPVIATPELVAGTAELPPIPLGWTELIHGTNSQRWAEPNDSIVCIKGYSGLSVVDAQEKAQEAASEAKAGYPGAYDTTRSYSSSRDPATKAIELSIIAPSQAFAPRCPIPKDLQAQYDKLDERTKEQIPHFYPINERHPYVPRGEFIIKIGEWQDDKTGRTVKEYLPSSVADSFLAALEESGTSQATLDKLYDTVTEARKYISKYETIAQNHKTNQQKAHERLTAAKERQAAAIEEERVELATSPEEQQSLVATEKRLVCDLNVTIRKNTAVRLMRESRLLRPSSPEDMAYRDALRLELANRITEAVPKDSWVRFHGTSLLNTEDIIKDGQISSAVDRTGTEASYDASDQVSVTMPRDVAISIDDRLGLDAESRCLPVGCLFMLRPKDAEEAASGKQMLMDNVYFKEHPEQLVGILTSGENLPMVRKWLTQAGMSPALAQEFFAGVEQLKDVQTPAE